MAVVNVQRIDEINILQPTLEGMRMAVEGVMSIDGENQDEKGKNVASAERKELSYVITGGGRANHIGGTKNKPSDNS